MIVIHRPPLPKLPHTTIVSGVALTFVRGTQFGQFVGVAVVREDDPNRDAVERKVRAMPRQFSIASVTDDIVSEAITTPAKVDDAPVAIVSEAPAAAKDPQSNTRPVAEQALANGWTMGDITGTGRDDDPSKGRSVWTGLTLAEMALTSPPKDWHLLGKLPLEINGVPVKPMPYPWMLDWKPPGIGWKPPTEADGLDPQRLNQSAEKPPEAATVDGPPAGDEPAAGDGEKPPAGEPITEPKPAETPKSEPKPADDVLAGYGTSEQIAQARAVLKQLQTEAGKPPTVNKAKFHLEQQKLPKVNAAQLAALLS